MHYLSLHKYPYEALMVNELNKYPHVKWEPNLDTEKVLATLSLGHVHQWRNVAVLIFYTVAYRLIYYFHLLLTRKHTRK